MPSQSVSWGAWAGDGANGLLPIDPEAGLALLGSILGQPRHTIVAPVSWDTLRRRTKRKQPLFELVAGSPEGLPDGENEGTNDVALPPESATMSEEELARLLAAELSS